jgi:hypothetical protein
LLVVVAYWLSGMLSALSADLGVQDDARAHVFWMQRFFDPELFNDDLISDYFQSMAPIGYRTFFSLGASLGIDPFDFSKILPLFLALISAVLAFLFVIEIFPLPIAAFTSAILVSQTLCLTDSMASGTPRAFAVPLLLGFLYSWLNKRVGWAILSLVLQAAFYPHMVLLSIAIGGLSLIRKCGASLAMDRKMYVPVAILVVAGSMLLYPYAASTSRFGPTVTRAQARTMAEFQKEGRTAFFDADALRFWLKSQRSGFLPSMNRNNPLFWLGLFLPAVLMLSKPARVSVTHGGQLLRVVLASGLLYGVAHVAAFSLHNPSRYTQFSVFLVLNISAGIVLAIALLKAMEVVQHTIFKQLGWIAMTIAILAVWLLLPIKNIVEGSKFPNYRLEQGEHPVLYEYLRTTPKETLTASLSEEADFIPSLALRPVLIAREYAVPYQLGYYRQFRERARDLIRAQYSSDPGVLASFIKRYGVDLLLIDAHAFQKDYLMNSWVRQYLTTPREINELLNSGGEQSIVAGLRETCKVLDTAAIAVLDCSCLIEHARAIAN